ncbi:MAG: helix-turn-helix domain-containing protein [Bacteroidota bacterium]|nr:helix-turn-helix domain-containing protein [Bacteroidota bacterium]
MENSKKNNNTSDLNKEEKEKDNESYSLEIPLEKSIISKIIKTLRNLKNYSQTRLGRILGVQKTQISKLEKGESNITIGTLFKVFAALKAKVSFKIKLENTKELEVLKKVIKEEKIASD